MIPVHKAKSIIQKYIPRLEETAISLNKLDNRILAQDIKAPFPMPQFDNSAMDGFAVRCQDTESATESHPVTLKMSGVSSAGAPYDLTLEQGECVQCMTEQKFLKALMLL